MTELWIVPCFLILLMQAGFALLETGLCRAKNAANTMSMNFMAYALGITAFWAVGFALMFGGVGSPAHSVGGWGEFHKLLPSFRSIWGFRAGGHWWGIISGRGFFLIAGDLNPAEHSALISAFLCMMFYMSVAGTIPTGTLAERWSLKSFPIFTFLIGALIFPVFGCWMWGGGWLAQLGKYLQLGNGAVDYAGSSVVHLLGGTLALAGTLSIGPRIGKYDEHRHPRPIFGHHVPMVLFGTLLLAFAWFGFNTSRSFAAHDGLAATVAVNTALASAAGALAAAFYMWTAYGKPDPSLMCNGMLGALVASCASCAYIEPWAAFLIGAIAGILAVYGVLFLERRRIDDPVGAISVHGLNGLWGMIALGLFATGRVGQETNEVITPVRGLFYAGGYRQLFAQLIASGVCIVWAFTTGSLAFFCLRRFLGANRVSIEVEIAGLDIAEMGAGGYPEFVSNLAPEQIPASEITANRRQ